MAEVDAACSACAGWLCALWEGRQGAVKADCDSPVKHNKLFLIFISQGRTNYAYQKAKLHNRVSLSPSFRCVKMFCLAGLCSQS